MIFTPSDNTRDLTNRRVSENGLIEIGVYAVMFGHRVRAGFTTDRYSCVLDWCGGAEWSDVERLYSLAVAILSKRDEDEFCFDGLPTCSRVKPFHRDPEFTETLVRLAGDLEFDPIGTASNWRSLNDEETTPNPVPLRRSDLLLSDLRKHRRTA